MLDIKDGLHKEYYTNKKIMYECTYINNKVNGFYKTYKLNGELDYISYDINDLEFYLEFYDNEFIINI